MSAVVDVAEAVGLSPGTLHVDLYGWVVEAGVANDRVQKIARSLLDGEQMPFLLFGKPASPVTTESEAAGGIGELKSAISGRQPILITLTHTSATFQYRNENGEAVSRKRNLVFNVLSEISDEEDRISGLSITPATFFGKGESAVWNDSEEELRLFFLAPIIRCKRPVDALPTESDLMRGNTQEKQQEKTEGELGDSGIEEEADIAKKEKPGSPAASGKSSPVRLTARMLHDLHTREVEKRKTMSRQQSGLSQLEQQKSPAEDGECESGQAKSFHQSHIATIRKSSLAESRFTEVNKQLGTALPEKDSDAHEDDSSGLAGIPSLSPLDARRASWTAQTRGSPPNGTGGTILEPRHCAKQITSTTIRQMFDEGFPIPKEADPVVYALSLFLCIQKGWPEGERFSGKAPRWTGTNFESFTYDVKDTRRSVEAFFYDQNVFQAGQATSVQGLARELQLHRRINHPGIRRLEGVWQHGNRLVIVFDLPKGGDLLDHLHKFGTYTEKEASKLVHLLLSTLNFLHDHGVIHRDLKPSNVFLTSDTHRSTVILGNLQSAAFDVPWPIPFKNKYGSPGYVAPEILREQAHDSKTDVFSVGVLLFIVLSGKPPFAPGKADNKGGSGPGSYQVWKEVLLNNARCNWSFEDEVWLKVSPAAKHLVTATLQESPEARPKATEAFLHPWVQQFGVTRWRRRLSIGVGVSPPESPEGGETQLSAEGEVEDEAALEQTNREISTSWLSNLKLWSTQQANSSSSCSPPNTTRSPPAQAKNTKKKAPGSPAQWEGGGESEKGERDPSRSKPRGNRSLRAVSLHSNGEFKSKSEGRSPPVSPEAGGWHYQSVAEASPPSAGGGGELGLSTGTNSRPAMRRSDSRRRSSVAFSSLVAHEGGTVGYISDFAQQGSNRAYTLSAATRASPVTFSMASRPSSQAAGSAPRSPAGFGYVPTWRGEKKKDDKLTPPGMHQRSQTRRNTSPALLWSCDATVDLQSPQERESTLDPGPHPSSPEPVSLRMRRARRVRTLGDSPINPGQISELLSRMQEDNGTGSIKTPPRMKCNTRLQFTPSTGRRNLVKGKKPIAEAFWGSQGTLDQSSVSGVPSATLSPPIMKRKIASDIMKVIPPPFTSSFPLPERFRSPKASNAGMSAGQVHVLAMAAEAAGQQPTSSQDTPRDPPTSCADSGIFSDNEHREQQALTPNEDRPLTAADNGIGSPGGPAESPTELVTPSDWLSNAGASAEGAALAQAAPTNGGGGKQRVRRRLPSNQKTSGLASAATKAAEALAHPPNLLRSPPGSPLTQPTESPSASFADPDLQPKHIQVASPLSDQGQSRWGASRQRRRFPSIPRGPQSGATCEERNNRHASDSQPSRNSVPAPAFSEGTTISLTDYEPPMVPGEHAAEHDSNIGDVKIDKKLSLTSEASHQPTEDTRPKEKRTDFSRTATPRGSLTIKTARAKLQEGIQLHHRSRSLFVRTSDTGITFATEDDGEEKPSSVKSYGSPRSDSASRPHSRKVTAAAARAWEETGTLEDGKEIDEDNDDNSLLRTPDEHRDFSSILLSARMDPRKIRQVTESTDASRRVATKFEAWLAKEDTSKMPVLRTDAKVTKRQKDHTSHAVSNTAFEVKVCNRQPSPEEPQDPPPPVKSPGTNAAPPGSTNSPPPLHALLPSAISKSSPPELAPQHAADPASPEIVASASAAGKASHECSAPEEGMQKGEPTLVPRGATPVNKAEHATDSAPASPAAAHHLIPPLQAGAQRGGGVPERQQHRMSQDIRPEMRDTRGFPMGVAGFLSKLDGGAEHAKQNKIEEEADHQVLTEDERVTVDSSSNQSEGEEPPSPKAPPPPRIRKGSTTVMDTASASGVGSSSEGRRLPNQPVLLIARTLQEMCTAAQTDWDQILHKHPEVERRAWEMPANLRAHATAEQWECLQCPTVSSSLEGKCKRAEDITDQVRSLMEARNKRQPIIMTGKETGKAKEVLKDLAEKQRTTAAAASRNPTVRPHTIDGLEVSQHLTILKAGSPDLTILNPGSLAELFGPPPVNPPGASAPERKKKEKGKGSEGGYAKEMGRSRSSRDSRKDKQRRKSRYGGRVIYLEDIRGGGMGGRGPMGLDGAGDVGLSDHPLQNFLEECLQLLGLESFCSMNIPSIFGFLCQEEKEIFGGQREALRGGQRRGRRETRGNVSAGERERGLSRSSKARTKDSQEKGGKRERKTFSKMLKLDDHLDLDFWASNEGGGFFLFSWICEYFSNNENEFIDAGRGGMRQNGGERERGQLRSRRRFPLKESPSSSFNQPMPMQPAVVAPSCRGSKRDGKHKGGRWDDGMIEVESEEDLSLGALERAQKEGRGRGLGGWVSTEILLFCLVLLSLILTVGSIWTFSN